MNSIQHDNANLLAYLGKIYFNLNPVTIVSELEPLPDMEARMNRLRDMIAATGTRVETDDLREAARGVLERLKIGVSYRPAARLRGPVTLFRAKDAGGEYAGSKDAGGEEYGLRAACAGELSVQTLPASHRNIVGGDAAQAVAEYISKLLAQR